MSVDLSLNLCNLRSTYLKIIYENDIMHSKFFINIFTFRKFYDNLIPVLKSTHSVYLFPASVHFYHENIFLQNWPRFTKGQTSSCRKSRAYYIQYYLTTDPQILQVKCEHLVVWVAEGSAAHLVANPDTVSTPRNTEQDSWCLAPCISSRHRLYLHSGD